MGANGSVLAIDIGGQSVRVAIVDASRQIVIRSSQPTAQSGADAIVETIKEAVADWPVFGAIGVSVPGHILSDQGVVAWAPNLLQAVDGRSEIWTDVPLGAYIEQAFGIRAVLMNDANAAGVAEFLCGNGRDAKTLVHLTLGTGVGGAVIFSGDALWPSVRGWASMVGYCGGAGELGHARTGCDPNKSTSGNDTLEHRCGAKFFVPRLIADERLGGVFEGVPEAEVLVQLSRMAEQGDALACEMWEEYGRDLGASIGSFVNIFGPDRVTLGGQIANAYDHFERGMLNSGKELAIPTLWDRVRVLPSALGDDAGLIGAAEAARQVK